MRVYRLAMLLAFVSVVSARRLTSSSHESRSREDGIHSHPDCEDKNTTMRELGRDVLARAVGRSPVAWEEKRLAFILASIDEAGYGEVNQLKLHFSHADESGTALGDLDLIVKRFSPKPLHDALLGSISAVRHDRHMRSFVVEAAFYVNLSAALSTSGLALPRLFYATEPSVEKPFSLVLEDLSRSFPRGANAKLRHMSSDEVFAAVRWLAGFHARFWEDPRTEERGLWPRGSYWHLDLLGRLEMESVAETYSNQYISNAEWKRLRAAAKAIDRRLAGQAASALHNQTTPGGHRFRTLLHGDAKPANILCSPGHGDQVTCAGIDFSWVGEGYGMYDIMYLLWGEHTQDTVDEYLFHYHAELLRNLPRSAGIDYRFSVMRQHFELCVVDFIRWWAGFKDGAHFWAMPWALDILREVLHRLDAGELGNEFHYAEAVDRVFPV